MDFIQAYLADPLKLALVWSLLALGVYLSFRILDVADLSLEGTFPVAAVLTILLINAGVNPWLAQLIALLVGVAMGLLVAALNVYLKIPFLLSGIIVMTGLISVAVVLSNGTLSLSDTSSTIYGPLISAFVPTMGKYWGRFLGTVILLLLIDAVVAVTLYWFFGTELGLAVRATGKNKGMAVSEGISNKGSTLIAMGISGALIALAGSLYAQMQTFSTSDMGQGTLVLSLAIVFLGELVIRTSSFKWHLVSIFLGGFVYWLILGAVERIPSFDSRWIYMVQAAMMALVMLVPFVGAAIKKKWPHKKKEALTHA
jgi:putative ABC transport system permease protein